MGMKRVASGIYKRGEYQYMVRIRRKGVNKSQTFETFKEAEEWKLRLEGKIVGNEFADLTLAHETTLRDALIWYKETVVPRKPKSVRHKKPLLNYWLNHEFADFVLSGLDTLDLNNWRIETLNEDEPDIEERIVAASPQTVLHRLNLLSHLYNVIIREWGLSNLRNPVVPGLRPKVNNSRKRRLRRHSQEEERLFQVCDNDLLHPWLGTVVRLALDTAIRRNEMYKIEWNDIDLTGEYPSIFLPDTKTEDPRTIPLWEDTVKLLNDYADRFNPYRTGKLFPVNNATMLTRTFEDAVKEAEIEDLRLHDLRHEGISRLFEETSLRDIEIMGISGHRHTSMLKRYTHLRSKEFSKFERRIPAKT